jgi:hypothetical protein
MLHFLCCKTAESNRDYKVNQAVILSTIWKISGFVEQIQDEGQNKRAVFSNCPKSYCIVVALRQGEN